jgi:hypothetical protein
VKIRKILKNFIIVLFIFMSSLPRAPSYSQVSNSMLDDQWFIIPPDRATGEQHLKNFMNIFTLFGAMMSVAGIASAFNKPSVLKSLKIQGRKAAISRAVLGFLEGALTFTSVELMLLEFDEILKRVNRLCQLRDEYQPEGGLVI